MTDRRPSVLRDDSYVPQPHRAHQDVFPDMQYAKHGCAPGDFLAEPWKYCQDPTNTYLSLRFDQRKDFKSKLNKKQLDRIQHEEKRIEQTRVNFSSYERKKSMMEDLKMARREWKMEVRTRCGEYVNKIQERGPKLPLRWNRNQELDLRLLDRVKAWNVDDDPFHSNLSPHLEPEYGFKACAMYFKKEKKGAGYDKFTYDHPKFLPGSFPNQKLLVHTLLEDKDDNPLSKSCPDNQLRYFHFPTNNMRWIEKAMARYYNQEDGDHSDLKPSNKMTKAEKLLCREFWRGQLHGGDSGSAPIHARHMRSRCSIIPSDSGSGTYVQTAATSNGLSLGDHSRPTRDSRTKPKNFAIFLPYLHWETDARRARMAEVIKEVTLELQESTTVKPRSSPNSNGKKSIFQVLHDRSAKTKRLKEQMKRFEKPKKTKLGQYLFNLAQVADAMDYEADERLLRDNLHSNPPLHIRRTLDQSYFLTLDDTAARDKDQVVYRETREGRSFYSMNTRVVMVDQLWLWILDDNTIITSFPRRWGRNKPDPSGVHKSLRERLAQIPTGQIKSIYDLALIIMDQCSRVFFDRTKPLDQRPEVMDLFASAIGNVTELTTIAFESFWRNMEMRALRPPPYGDETAPQNQKYLDINPEGTLLREAQDIAEELQIMLRIYNQQLHVVKDLRKTLGHMNGESKNEHDEVRKLVKLMIEHWQNQTPNSPGGGDSFSKKDNDVVPESTIQEANDLLELIRNRKSEIQDLEDAALRTCQQLQGLLSLKQQQASIIEAKAALSQTRESVKQGRAIMAFTLVTIFFLPLGFFAAFFGMNNQEINQSPWMTLDEQVKYMFGISAAVIVIAISMAFSPWTRATLTVLVKVPLAFIAEYTGLRYAWRNHIIDHQTLERRGQSQLDYIYKREKRLAAREKEKEDKKKKEDANYGLTEKTAPHQLVEAFFGDNTDGETVNNIV